MIDNGKDILQVDTVTVVGATGTMGRNISAIFAAFGNAKVYMVSRDMKKSEAARNKAYHSVRAESVKKNMVPVDYSMLDQCVAESDIVFESSAENWEVKVFVTKMIAEAALKNKEKCKRTLFCTGTSGLSVTSLSELYPADFRGNCFGMHFFNPPYTMTLCEMIPTEYSDRELFEMGKEYCKTILHRTVVEVKDSPAFLGNRIGFRFINEAFQFAEKYQYSGGIDYMDAILGPFTGRNMAPLATSNFVGLDVHKAIVDNLYENTNDFAREDFLLPAYVEELIRTGRLGKKTGGGIYKTVLCDRGTNIHQVYDIATGVYRDVMKYTFSFVESIVSHLKEGDYQQACEVLKKNHSQEAEICLYFLLKYILYSLAATEQVGYDIHSADDVMASGFSWCPPLAWIQALGGSETFQGLCSERIPKAVLSQLDMACLLKRAEPSQYDYRKFIRAKR